MNILIAESEKKLHNLFECMANGIATYSSTEGQNFVLTGMNSAAEKISGVTFRDISGKEVREIIPGVVEMGLYDVLKRVWASGTAESIPDAYYEDRHITRYYENRVYKISGTEIAAVYNDITEQKKAHLELIRREEQLRVLFESSQAGILMVDPTGTIILANNRLAEMLGSSMDELLRTRYQDHLHSSQRSSGADRMKKVIDGEIDHIATERHFIRKDGSDFWGYISVRRHEDSEGNLISLVGHITDISEFKQKENMLKASEKKFRMLFEHSADPSLLITGNTFVDCNQAAVEILHAGSKAEVLNMHPSALSPEYQPDGRPSAEKADEMIATAVRNGSHRFEWAHSRVNGEVFPVEVSLTLLQETGQAMVFTVWRDISERKQAEDERRRLERQILHAQKLESLGVLAGGIAHDFNNILTAIIGNADLALMRLNPESPAIGNLHNIEHAAARAADLAKQMLAYSGKGKFVVENLDLNILLEEMLHMLEVSISKKAVLRLNLSTTLPLVEADVTQMRQIVMNIVINASEAIGDASGVIAFTTGCMDCDRNYLKDVWLDGNLTDGLYVFLEIADTGCGMDKETMAKLFDPFFTTKFTGRGLGMAAVLGIVRGHRGGIKVYSELKKGTTFKILLPASGKQPELFDQDSHADEWKGSGTVLLVDDEEAVRGIGSVMLRELGFEVLTANDGWEAVEIFKSTPDIACVILDLTMPHMDGEQCFRELRQLNPCVKVIMSSGYNEQEVTQKFVGKGLAGFLQKPYKLSLLKETLKGLKIHC